MSTATPSTSGYAECDEFIEHRIRVARNRIKWTDLLTALLLAGVLLIGYVLIFTLCDHWLIDGGFAAVTRAVMLGVVVLLCAAIVYRYVIRPWTKEIHPLYAAKMLDGSGGSMDGALLSAVDLGSSGSAASETVRRSIEKRAAVGLAAVNIDEAIDRKWLMNLGITLFFLVLFTCVYAVFSPKSMNLLRPLSLSNAAVATQTRILRVQPGNAMIQSGEELEIIVDIAGNIPDAVHVLFTTQDQTYVDEKLTMSAADDSGRYRVNMVGDSDRGLRQNFIYRVVAGDAASESFEVVVDEPPTANVSLLEYAYPEYMSLPDRSTENGNIDAWEGTDVFITAETNVPVRLAILKFSDDSGFTVPAEEFSLTPDGNQLSGRLRLQIRDDGSSPKYYRIDVTDVDGRTDPQPTVYSIRIRPDKAPVVKLLDPMRDMRVPANAIVPLLVEAEDPDFLLRSVKLELEVNGEPRSDQLLFDSTRAAPTRSWNGTWDLDLEPLGLLEGDVVRYQVAARDNKPPFGSQQRTGTLQLFVEQKASEEQVQQQLAEDRQLQEQQRRESDSPRDPQNEDSTQPSRSGDSGQPVEAGEMPSDGIDPADSDQTQQAKDPDSDTAPSDTATGPDGELPAAKDSESSSKPDAENPATDSAEESGQKEESSTGSSKQGDSGRQKDMTDGDALQEILDAYKDKIDPDAGPDMPEDNPGEAGIDSPEAGDPDNGSLETPPQNGDDSSDSDASMDSPSDNDTSADSGNPPDENLTGDASQEKNDDRPNDGMPNDQPLQNGDGTPEDSNQNDETAPDESQSGKSGNDQTDPEAGQDVQDGMQNDPDDPANKGAQETDKADPSGNGEDGDQPENKEGEESGEQEGESGRQGEDSGKQEGESGRQGEDSGKQEGESGKQGEDSGKQDGESGKQGEESGKQDGESGKQGKESGKQDGESGKQGEEPGKQGGESGKQGGESGEQGGESGKQGGESGKQGGESGKQGGESGKQGGESGKQGGESGKQGGESGKQGGESGKQGGESGKQGGESGKQGGESGKQGAESGKQGGESGKQGGESGKKGGESGKLGGESGKQGGKSGKQGGESGKKDGESGEKGGESGKEDGESGEKGGEAGKEGGQQKGGGGEGKGKPGGEKGSQAGTGGQGKKGSSASGGGNNPAGGEVGAQASGSSQGGKDEPGKKGSGGGEPSKEFKADKANVTDAAQAADLVLKRLKKDLDRGRVDKELLEKLGWTKDELQAFSERIQKEINTVKEPNADATKSQQLQKRRNEELLKSLNLNSKSSGQIGNDRRDTEQKDTTILRSPAPARYKDLMELYRRSLSEGDR